MSAIKSNLSVPSIRRVRAFTLLEILVVVGIIILLMALLIPAISAAKRNAKIASTRSTLSSLRTGLASYYSNFNSYPDSHPTNITSGTYGTAPPSVIPPGRGPALLAQALMGYLPGSLDGAGPDKTSSPNASAYAGDPHLGFRTRNTIMPSGGIYTTPTAVGKVYGPYGPDNPAAYKINVDDSATPRFDQSFYDSFGGEILYFRAQACLPK